MDRAENCAPRLAEVIDNAVDERGFRANDGEIDPVIRGDLQVISAREAGRGLGDARISGSCKDVLDGWALGETPSEGMLTAARSDNKYVQRKSSSS